MFTRFLPAFALACAALAQTPAFEVASVKISEPITPALVESGRLNMGVTIDSIHVRINKLSMLELVALAYQIKGHQISGPDWISTQRYDTQAKLPEGSSRGQVPAMLQTLIAERFGMRFHRETRDFNVFALVVAKGGPHLKAAADEETPPPPAAAGPIRGGVSVGPGGTMAFTRPGGNSKVTPGPSGNLHIETKKMTMKALADFISRYYDRPLVDMTGLTGAYDMEFDVSGEEVRNAARAHGMVLRAPELADAASEPAGASLPSSLQKLGLKLESRKAPAEVIVIDKVEKIPSDN
jgi:uncharacterized protein (TIGR03435 family)